MLFLDWTGGFLVFLPLFCLYGSNAGYVNDIANAVRNCNSRNIRTSCGNSTESVVLTANVCTESYRDDCDDCVPWENFRHTLMMFEACRRDERILRIVIKKYPSKENIDFDWLSKEKRSIHKRQAPIVQSLKCTSIEPPKPGKISCRIFTRGMSCVGHCNEGYLFDDGTRRKVVNCSKDDLSEGEEEDALDVGFPTCEPQCHPICRNGGICSDVDSCSCTNEFRGETCEYPISLCGITKTSSASSWQCNHTRTDTVCRVACYPPGSLQAENQAKDHYCSINGTWEPALPVCVQPYARLCSKPGFLQYGRMDINSSDIFPPGTMVSYSCNLGFSMRGAKDRVCLMNGTWSESSPVCIMEYGCSHPGEIENGRDASIGHDYPVGGMIIYSCEDGYILVGNSSLTCLASGRWSSNKPSCWRPTLELQSTSRTIGEYCAFTSTPRNALVRFFRPDSILGFLLVTEDKDEMIFGSIRSDLPIRTFPVGFRIHYRCRTRFYKLYGSEYQTCQASGTWSGNKPACVPDCGKSDSPRTPFIIYGNSTEIGQWPWQVAISVSVQPDYSPYLVCGGALVGEKFVLTAAHCITREHSAMLIDQRLITVHCGKYYRSFEKDDKHVQARKVRRIIVHMNYDFIKYDSDIALLELESPVEFTSRVQPICLPTEATTSDNIRDGQLGVVLGWGLTEQNRFTDALRETILPVVSRSRCEENYRQGLKTISVTENMFCAGYEEGRSDTCTGDSGGIMMFPDSYQRPPRWIMEGIISWGSANGCGIPKQFAGFTKVGKFVDWIKLYI